MKQFLGQCALVCAGIVGLFTSLGAGAAPALGEPVPPLQLRDVHGKSINLADHKGKLVVLEWFNPNCPFVQKHYGSNNMQSLQARYTKQGVHWFLVNSTNPTHPDFLEPSQLASRVNELKAHSTAVLMDADGKAGREWGAKTTPHMYVIDAQGKLVFEGGIDDKRSSNPADIKLAKNYVAAALDEVKAGKPVSVSNSRPYGCSVKY